MLHVSRFFDWLETLHAEFILSAFEPFSLPFMQQAFVIVVIISIPTSLLSCFLVLKGWSLMGDAIAHAILPGIIIAYITKIPYSVGAFCAAVFCTLATGFVKENSRLKEDTVMGIVFSGMFAAGLILMVKVESNIHLDHILFGDILGLDWNDVKETGLLSILISILILIKSRDFLVFIFDKDHSHSLGISLPILQLWLLVLISLTVVSSLKVVGMILVIAMLIAPGAIGFLLARSFKNMILLALSVSTISSVLAVYLSFFIDSAPAPTIIMVLMTVFISSFLYKQMNPKILVK